MTEKRFTITNDFEEHHKQIRDNGKIIMGCFLEPQAEPIVKLLNDLNDENEQLKKDVKRYSLMINTNSDLNDEIYEQLKKTEKNYKSLLKENMQLKSEINMLKYTISRNEAFIERITSNGKWNNTSMKQGDVE